MYRFGWGFPQWLSSKESVCNARDSRDLGLISGSGRSPGGRQGNPVQYSCLENSMDRGAWWAIVHRVTKSQTWLKRLSMQAHTHWLLVLSCLGTFTSSCMCAKLHQSCPTLCDSIDYSPPGSSVHGILQARILEWVTMPSSRESSQFRDHTQVSCIAGEFFAVWAPREC